MKMKSILLIIFLICVNSIVKADGGMWFLPLLDEMKIGKMTQMGLKLDKDDIYSLNHSSLKDAIVLFGGGCTASVISDEGLLLTVHHCARGTLSSLSTGNQDLLKDGFWAQAQDQELYNPGESATFIVSMSDVTDSVLKGIVNELPESERQEIIRNNISTIINQTTANTFYDAEVKSFFNDNRYYLVVSETYTDVRIVGAPPASVGYFGGETDNFKWPRFTGDFALFRIYTGPDGRPAGYSPENIPLKPRNFLRISLNGYNPGDFAFVLGFPGNTNRFETSDELEEYKNTILADRIYLRGKRLAMMDSAIRIDPITRNNYEMKYLGGSNFLKYSTGIFNTLDNSDLLNSKEKNEDEYQKWLKTDIQNTRNYSESFGLINTSIQNRKPLLKSMNYLQEGFLSVEIIYLASKFNKLYEALSFQKYDSVAVPLEIEKLKTRVNDFYKSYNSSLDKKIFEFVAGSAISQLGSGLEYKYMPAFLSPNTNVFQLSNSVFSNSIFKNEQKITDFLKNPSRAILDSDTAFLIAHSSLYELAAVRQELNSINLLLNKGRRIYMAGLMEMWNDSVLCPDANRTLRLSYGSIAGQKVEGENKYMTTVGEMLSKEQPGNWEFEIDPKFKSSISNGILGKYAENKALPLCFLTNNDITGGNSGSPVLNRNGDLIGLTFDGNEYAMVSELLFDDKNQRCINLDIRFVLFMIDEFARCERLVKEIAFSKN